MKDKEKNVSYSIIIPHKNIPNLLLRCIDSIPRRNDVEIIIIDDNSDPSLVDFNHFPGIGESNTEVIFSKENKGAGYARNIGLEIANGHWLVFADADDFFNDSLNELFDKYKYIDADLVLFKSNSVDSESLSLVNSRGSLYNIWLDKSCESCKVIDEVRYNINPPWAKFFKREFIITNNIVFDEVTTGNDVMFSTIAGHLSDKILIDKSYLYCSTVRIDSLDNQYKYDSIISRLNVALNQYKFLSSINKTKYRSSIWSYINQIRQIENSSWINTALMPTFKILKFRDFLSEMLKLMYFYLKK